MKKILGYFSVVLIILLLASCGGDKTVLLKDVPDAENAAFSPDGRLFVTGNKNIYEIVKTKDGTFSKLSIYNEGYEFTGVAVRNGTLYAACRESKFFGEKKKLLLAGPIQPGGTPALEPIAEFPDAKLLNGMAFDAYGRLYLCDLGGKIWQVLFKDNAPTMVKENKLWYERELNAANGIAVVDNYVFVTENNFLLMSSKVRRIKMMPDGSSDVSSVIMSRWSILDEITLYREGLLIADYSKGRLIYIDYNGHVLGETGSCTHCCASSAIPALPPMFKDDSLIVTEKGILKETCTGAGNKLVLVEPF